MPGIENLVLDTDINPLAAVSSHQPVLDSMFQSVREEVYRLVPGEVLQFDVEYL